MIPAASRAGTLAAVIIGGAVLLAGCSAAPAPVVDPTAGPTGTGDASPSAPAAPLEPASGVYLGVYYGDGTPAETDAAIGRTPQIRLTYVGWEDPWATDDTIPAAADAGQISLVNWEPFDVEFSDIVAGRYDDMLTQRATEAAGLEAPVFVDFAAEMNEEEGWGGHDPELYIAAYRHVRDVFTAHDGGNTVWVWAPNNVDSADAPAAMDYYPGDAWVDWTGIDGYNWGTSEPGFTWQSFAEVFRPMYDDLQALGKPIMIGETASDEVGGDKAAWIAAIAPTLQTEFPAIRAVVWFDVDKERDWRIRSSDAAAAAIRDLAADPLFETPDD